MSATVEDTPPPPRTTVREPTTLEQISGLAETVRRVVAERDKAQARARHFEEYAAALRAENADLEARLVRAARRADDAEIVAERALATAARERAARERVDAENRLLRAQPGRSPRTVKRRPWRGRRH